ncbi:MAG: hypothetical protein HDT33_09440 [Clostridiales bacterium]|nr:hypothetical protein [Clostridiales bacterium]
MNTGALILGLTAWELGALGAVAAFRQKRGRGPMYSIGSFIACSGSLCLELLYQAHLAAIEDISAFLDTANAVALCAGALLLGTLVLNATALIIPSQWRSGMSG